MGRVKDHFWDQISGEAQGPSGPAPTPPNEQEMDIFFSEIELEKARDLVAAHALRAPLGEERK